MLIDMDFQEYLADPAIGRSDVDNFIKYKSPRKYKFHKDNPKPPNAAMAFGTLVHTLILEPDKFEDEIIVLPGASRNSNAYKAIIQSDETKTVVLQKEVDKANYLRDAFMSHDITAGLLDHAEVEKTALFEWNGISCKARFDILSDGSIWDIKTTEDASPEAFTNTIRNYYVNQIGFYMKAAEICELEVTAFNFIAIEKSAPFEIAVYTAGKNLVDEGQARILEALPSLNACVANDSWPGYPAEITEIT